MPQRCFDESAIARARDLRASHAASPLETKADILSELGKYPFYHCIEIAPGIETPGIQWTRAFVDQFVKIIPMIRLAGKRVLDIGCRDGAQALEMEKAGAAEIHCIDNDLSPGLVNFLIPFLGSKIQCHELNLYDLGDSGIGSFDLVNFCGVLYHLQFPLWGLKQIRDVLRPGGTLILETGIITGGLDHLPMMAYLTGASSPYVDGTSPTFFNHLGLKNALELLDFEDLTVRELSPQPNFDSNLRRIAGRRLKLKCGRLLLTCRRKAAAQSDESAYFERTHHVHSAGTDRPRS